MDDKPHYVGHRDRLRQRFLNSESLPDYELLELLLFQGNPRKDTKPMAKKLLQQFGSLERVLSADAPLLTACGLNRASVTALKLVYLFHEKLLKESLFNRAELGAFDNIKTYCHRRLAPLHDEAFLVLYLDSNFGVIYDEIHQEGTVNRVVIYPRNIIKVALDRGASKIIIAHNHPGGNPKPSFEDLQLTHKIAEMGRLLDVQLVDHFIIARDDVVSLKAEGHIK